MQGCVQAPSAPLWQAGQSSIRQTETTLANVGASSAFSGAFWDARAGAFSDTTTDRATHPQDGNAFAVLAGIATKAQAASALDYLWAHGRRDYGNTIVDGNVLWGYGFILFGPAGKGGLLSFQVPA